jgi:hypothetical protein
VLGFTQNEGDALPEAMQESPHPIPERPINDAAFVVRMPTPLRDRVKRRAYGRGESMGAYVRDLVRRDLEAENARTGEAAHA